MYTIKNLRTSKIIKDAITGKAMTFESKQQAQKFADSLTLYSVIDATALNRVRPAKHAIIDNGEAQL